MNDAFTPAHHASGFYPSLLLGHALNKTTFGETNWPVIILSYRRIADVRLNPWTLPTQVFKKQICWLKNNFDLISLSEAQRRMANGINKKLAVCVTFDYGYSDNCDFALPLMLRERVPCTYFVAPQNIFDNAPFEHDMQHGQPLEPNSVEELCALTDTCITIGAHSQEVTKFNRVSATKTLYDEVVTITEDLRTKLDTDVRFFAIPLGKRGQLNVHAFYLARDAGLDGVCSTYGGYNLPGDSPFHLRRIRAASVMLP